MAVGLHPDLSGNLSTKNECCEDPCECKDPEKDPEPVGALPSSFVYVANESTFVPIFDTSTNNVVGSITFPAGTITHYWAALPNSSKLYVTFLDSTSSGVFVIDPRSNSVVKTLRLASNAELWGIAVSPDGRTVYVTDYNNDLVHFIDTATDTLNGNIAVGNAPMGVAFTPNGQKAYVCNEVGAQSVVNHYGTVSVIDTTSVSVIATIDMPTRYYASYDADPHYVAISPDGTRAYITNGSSNYLTMVDTATDTVVKSLQLGFGGWELGIAISPDGRWAYICRSGGDEIAIVDLQKWVVTARIPVDIPYPVALSPDGSRIYTTSWLFADVDNFFVFDAKSYQVVAARSAGEEPWGVVLLPPPPVTGPQTPLCSVSRHN